MLDKIVSSAPLRVLLADDEVSFRSTTARLLERHGLICAQVSTADEAIALLQHEAFDVLVADIRMPGNDRLDLVRHVRALPVAPGVILVTGYPSVDTAMGSMDHGVYAYRVKPFDLEDFLQQVNDAGRRSRLLARIHHQHGEMRAQVKRLDALRELMKGSGTVDINQTTTDYLSLLMLSVADTALEAGSLLDCLANGQQPVRNLSRHPELDAYREAIRECIGVLEKTKNAFKSKELATLRRHLQMLVDVVGKA